MQATAFASAARTATPTPTVLASDRVRSLAIVINVTAVTSTPSVTFAVQAKDTASGQWFTILTSAAQAAITASPLVLTIGTGLPATANVSANHPIPDAIRIVPTHGNANSITYSVGVHLIR